MLKLLYLFLFLHIFNTQAKAQSFKDEHPDIKAIYYKDLQQIKLNYKKPKHYNEIFDDENAKIGYRMVTLSLCQLVSTKDSVLIYIAVREVDTTQKTRLSNKRFRAEEDGNKVYQRMIGDTTENKIIWHSKNYTKRMYNADESGLINIPLNKYNKYKDMYTKCDALFVHKKDRADLFLYYFYTESSTKNLDKHIKMASSIFKFDD